MQSIKANLGRVMHPHTVLTSQYLLDTSFLMNKKSKKVEGKGKKKKKVHRTLDYLTTQNLNSI